MQPKVSKLLQIISPVPILVGPSVKSVVRPNHKTAWKVSLASLSLQANLEGCALKERVSLSSTVPREWENGLMGH